ncbi:probable glycerone kinase isoform [Fusarium mangiferae]|uniref:Probable glycerone kinase isoform n=1 Tax=Fusarium mangiferae TaxID=192010 RepID=A0A1L7U6L2_FUSMA|nr:putative glycerone kinase isoform [Fusarium mangiferae]CVL03357.1 probable glycerone kinase isoform [Fusarium mangiferae]
MSDQHFFNNPSQLVDYALESWALINPSLEVDHVNKIVYRREINVDQVAVISGGGSGHEPAFSGLVGQGFLTASVAGTIFASPATDQILNGIIKCSKTSKGVLAIVMNYTGDVLNFGVAIEKARTMDIEVDMVVVGDDVGVSRSKGRKVGRRGIAGTVLVQKIACALAAQGRSLQDVASTARLAAANIASIGVSLAHVHVPGRSDTSRNRIELNKGEAELGMGIHNETGSNFEKADAAELVKKMLEQLLDTDDKDRAFLQVNAPVVLMVNNLGGVSVLELGAITALVGRQLASSYSIRPIRVLSGTYMTSLNGMGFSITLLNLDTMNNHHLLELLEAPAEAVGWSALIKPESWCAADATVLNNYETGEDESKIRKRSQIENADDVGTYDAAKATNALASGLRRLIKAEPEITRYDTIVGDGDCGIGLKRGAEAVLHRVLDQPLVGSAVSDLTTILPIIETSMDGTSGALYSIFLNALLHAFQSRGPGPATPEAWAFMLEQSSSVLARYTPARIGDRTVIDALEPFIQELVKTNSLVRAAEAAKHGAETTVGMKASLGRSVYIGGSGFQQVPDPGAWGLSEFLAGLAGLDIN